MVNRGSAREKSDGARRWLGHRPRSVVVAAGVASAGAAAAAWLVATPGGRAANGVDGVRFSGIPTVGALFVDDTATPHYCTAGVVSSPGRDLLVTAAHCVTGSGQDLIFVPGYRAGVAPYGVWRVIAAFGAPGWLSSQDPHEDVAFLMVADRRVAGRTQGIQDVTGAPRLGKTPSSGKPVTVIGYTQGIDDLPIRCRSDVYSDDGYPAFDCGGYVNGTSGSPWLVGGPSGGGTIVAISGGRNQGGCEPGTSYAAPFTTAIRQLYRQATSGSPPSIFPSPGPSGC